MFRISLVPARSVARFISVSALALVLSASSALALDLPVKKVKGKEYYYYKVEKNETIYMITHKLGIKHSEIVKYNPSVADGVKAGQTLYFPVEEYGSDYGTVSGTVNHVVRKGDTLLGLAGRYGVSSEAIVTLNPGADKGIKIGETLQIPIVGDEASHANVGTSTDNTDTEVPEVVFDQPAAITPVKPAVEVVEGTDYDPESRELSVVVCLPFMLGAEDAPRAAVHATDFYRGMLVGIDSLRSAYGNPRIRVTAVDGDDPGQPFNALTSQAEVFRAADIIVASDNIGRLEQLGKFGMENRVYVFNPFQARDTTCLTNPYMIQGNIPQHEMFDKAIGYFVEHLDGAVPVFLDNEKGTKDKQAFVDALTSRLVEDGIDFKTLKYNGTMTSTAMMDKLPIGEGEEKTDYVFVPMSGSLNEFHKFATALLRYNTEVEESETPGRVRLFAYPEYTRFSGEALEKLCAIETTFYTRFYNDATAPGTKSIDASFIHWFGTDLPDGVPNQALYGFDVARWMLSLASRGSLDRSDIAETVIEDGAQMNYKLVDVPGGGLINMSMYIVTLTPGPVTTITVL